MREGWPRCPRRESPPQGRGVRHAGSWRACAARGRDDRGGRRDCARDAHEREREERGPVDEEESVCARCRRGGYDVVECGSELIAVRDDLVAKKDDGWNRQDRRDQPLPGEETGPRDLAHDRVAETEWERARRNAREQLMRPVFGRLEIARRAADHAIFPFMRAASRSLRAALARWRCVFTVPSGRPRASATS